MASQTRPRVPSLEQPRLRIDYPDTDVCKRVSTFLRSRHFPAFQNLDVTVENGAVTLSGEVCSFYEKQVAMTTCQRVAGVLSLIDQIDVGEIKPVEVESIH